MTTRIRDCVQCGQKFAPQPGHKNPRHGRFCSRSCAGSFQRRANNDDGSTRYRYLARQENHPLVAEDGRLLEHRKVLFDSIGPGSHPCHWCGDRVTWQIKAYNRRGNLVVDHIDENRFNNDLSNLVPSCGPCNIRRSTKNLIKDDELFVVGTDGRRARATQRVCLKCGTEFLVQTRTLKIPNRGLYCSRTCKNKHTPKARTP